jgi:hypothetical protein
MEVFLRIIPTPLGDFYQKKVPLSKNPSWREWRPIGPKPIFDVWLSSVKEDKHIKIIWE